MQTLDVQCLSLFTTSHLYVHNVLLWSGCQFRDLVSGIAIWSTDASGFQFLAFGCFWYPLVMMLAFHLCTITGAHNFVSASSDVPGLRCKRLGVWCGWSEEKVSVHSFRFFYFYCGHLDLLLAFNTIVKGDLETRTHPPSFHEFRMSARCFFNLVYLFLLLLLIWRTRQWADHATNMIQPVYGTRPPDDFDARWFRWAD